MIWVICRIFGNKKVLPSYFIQSPEPVYTALLIWFTQWFQLCARIMSFGVAMVLASPGRINAMGGQIAVTKRMRTTVVCTISHPIPTPRYINKSILLLLPYYNFIFLFSLLLFFFLLSFSLSWFNVYLQFYHKRLIKFHNGKTLWKPNTLRGYCVYQWLFLVILCGLIFVIPVVWIFYLYHLNVLHFMFYFLILLLFFVIVLLLI